MTTVYAVLRALVGLEAGRACRRCNEPILAADAVGLSEGVSWPCGRVGA